LYAAVTNSKAWFREEVFAYQYLKTICQFGEAKVKTHTLSFAPLHSSSPQSAPHFLSGRNTTGLWENEIQAP